MSKLTVAVKTYVFRKEGTFVLKIGRTKNIEKRLRTLTTMSGCKLDVVAVIDGDIERLLHSKFSHLRMIGEWFNDSNGEVECFLKDEINTSKLIASEEINQKQEINIENMVNVITSRFFSKDIKPQESKLQNGQVGGGIALELYNRLPSHLFYEESAYGFLGCEAIAFIFDDAVYYVAPNFGIKFNTLDEYIQYHKKGQYEFSVENDVDIDELPNWDDYVIFMRNHAKPMIAEIERLNA